MASKKTSEFAFILAAVSADPIRSNLQRAFAQTLDGHRCLVGTDGHRVHVQRAPALIHRTDIAEGQQVILVPGAPIVGVPDSEQTPNVSQVIPRTKQDLRIVRIETEILRELTDVGKKDVGKKCRVRVEVSIDRIAIVGDQSTRPNSGVAYLHPRYLHEALIGVDSFDTEIELRGPLDPVIVRGVGQENSYAVIMPVRA